MRSMRDVLGVRWLRSSGGIARQRRKGRGQAAVEFALVLTVAMIVLFVAVQFALIGQIALALGQMNYQAARYAAIHPGCGATACNQTAGDPDVNSTAVKPYALSIRSPTIKPGSITTFTVDPDAGSTNGPDRAFGTSVKVTVAYDVTSQLFLPANFLGLSFPTTLNSTETAMSE
jgi:Flp pilus assembly protein TadG